MDSEVTNDKEKKREITDAISKWISLLTGIITLVVAIGNVALNFLNYDYARKAEDFYGISSRYFINSFVDDKVMTFVYIFSYFVILVLPFILKKLRKVKKLDIFESLLYSIVVVVYTSQVVYMSIIRITVFFNLQDSEILALIPTVIIAIITFGIYMYLLLKDFSKVRKKDLEKQENIIKEEKAKEENDKIAKMKKRSATKEVVESGNHEKEGDTVEENKPSEESIAIIKGVTKRLPTWFIGFIKELTTIILVAVLTIVVSSIFIITADRIIEYPQNKTQYEIVTINDGDKESEHQMAVVSYKNGKAILMDCTIIPQVTMNGKEIENLLLTKGKYRLIDIEGYQIEYKEFNAVKCE